MIFRFRGAIWGAKERDLSTTSKPSSSHHAQNERNVGEHDADALAVLTYTKAEIVKEAA